MKRYLSILFIFLSSCIYSQTKLSGVISDSLTGVVIPFTPVGLLLLPDSTIVKGTISDENGNYSVDIKSSGNYILKITAVGYAQKIIKNILIDSSSNENQVYAVKLNTSAKLMNEISVTAIKRTVEFKNNNITINVEDSPLAKGNSVFDLLSKIPGVSVEGDEIKIQGKSGVVVMIDERPQHLSSSQLANLLRGMSADLVNKIEVLKNPPVKYDASGTSGMINIISKKVTTSGFTGSVFLSYSQGLCPQSMAGVSLNFKSKKLTFYSSINPTYDFRRHVETLEKRFDQDSTASFLKGKNTVKNFYEGVNGKIGVDWYPKPTDIIGFKVEIDPGIFTTHSAGKNTLSGDKNASFNYLGSTGYYFDKWNQTNFNLNYDHKTDTLGSSISFVADYTIVPEYVSNDNINQFYNNSDQEILKPNNFRNIDDSHSSLLSGRVNSTTIIDSSSSIEAGIKISNEQSVNDFLFERDIDNNSVYVNDTSLSTKFKYSDMTYAGYFNYNKSIKKLSMQLGMRLERTRLSGITNKQQALKRNYFQLFPNLNFNYKKSENHDFQMSLSRRINRPDFFDLNPTRIYRDQFYYQQGNPLLLPTYANKVELSYNYKSSFSTSIAYTYQENFLLHYAYQIDTAKLTIETTRNIHSGSALEWSLFFQKSVVKNWEVSINGTLSYFAYDGNFDGKNLNWNGYASYGNITNTILLWKNVKMEVAGVFFGPAVDGIIKRGMNYMASIAFKTSFFKEKLDLTIGMDDVFHTSKWSTSSTFEGQNWTYSQRYDSMRFRIALNYKFGKIKIEERKVEDNDDKGRLGR